MSDVSHEKFAEPMLEDNTFLGDYKKKLKTLLKEGSIPKLDEKKTFKVYSIKGSSFGAHKSIVLTADDQHFFTVELGFITVDGVKRIYPVTRKLSVTTKEKLVYHGEIEGTAGDLISKAVGIMKKFGNYFKFCNNCQNYCNHYLDEIGLGAAKTLTDGDKAALVVIAAGILAFILSR